MTGAATPCPDNATLQRLLLGMVPAGQCEALEAHLSNCERCIQSASALTMPARDELLSELQSARLEAAEPQPPVVRELIERFSILEPSKIASSSDETAFTESATAGIDPAPLPQIPGYQAVSVIARGGMGIVVKARDLRLGRLVAIKMPLRSHSLSPQERERFEREARAAAGLRHPNICPIHEVGEVDGRPYIAMSFIEGATLKDWASDRTLSARDAARMVARLARAVDFAHRHRVVHRDLKPSNVMIESETGEPVLTDFGLAKELGADVEPVTVAGEIMGTPAYMAPEQAAGDSDRIGSRTDIYALGAILYELLSGQKPFQGSLAEILRKVQLDEPPPVRSLRASVHRDIETITLRCMMKDPRARYETAAELADDLERFEAGEPIRARRASLSERARRLSRRHPFAASLGVVVCLAALGGWLIGLPAYHSYRHARGEASKSQQVAARIGAIQSQLDAPRWRSSLVADVERDIRSLEALDAAQAARLQAALSRRILEAVDRRLSSPRLSEDDERETPALLSLLSLRAPESARLRQAQWEERLAAWEPVLTMAPPFDGSPEAALGAALQAVDDKFLTAAPPTAAPPTAAPITAAPITPVLLQPTCRASVRVEAEFAESWGEHHEIGLVLNASGGHRGPVREVAFAKNATWLAAGYDDGSIVLWDVAAGEQCGELAAHPGAVAALAACESRGWLASAGFDGSVRVWDVDRLAERFHFSIAASLKPKTSPQPALSLAFSPAGDYLAAGGGVAGTSGEVRVWRMSSGEPVLTTAAHADVVTALAFAPDSQGELFSASGDLSVRLWDLSTLESRELCRRSRISPGVPPIPHGLAVAPDGQSVVVAWGDERLWRVGREAGQLQQNVGIPRDGLLRCLATPNHETFAVLHNNAIELRDAASLQTLATLPRSGPLAFSADGERLAVGDSSGFLRIFQAPNWNERSTFGPRGYTFLLSTAEQPGSGDRPERRSLNDILRTEEGRVRLRLYRNATLLVEQEAAVTGNKLRLSATRDGAELRWQVNDGAPLVFYDILPLERPSAGRVAILWPFGAALTRCEIQQKLRAHNSPLQSGDALYANGNLRDALRQYRDTVRLESAGTERQYRREAECKMALCQLGMNRLDEAIPALQKILDERIEHDQWSYIALHQLLLTRVRAGDFDGADRVLRRGGAVDLDAESRKFVSESDRQDVLAAFAPLQEARYLLLAPNSLQHLRRAIELGEAFGMQRRELHNLRSLYVTALQEAGAEKEALSTVGELFKAMILESSRPQARSAGRRWPELCRWARIGGLSDKALTLVDGALYETLEDLLDRPNRKESEVEALVEPFGERRRYQAEQAEHDFLLLLERARLHAAQQAWQAAERDLSELQRLNLNYAVSFETAAWTHLLRGFLRQRQGDSAGARESWRTGVLSEFQQRSRRTLKTLDRQSLLLSLALEILSPTAAASDSLKRWQALAAQQSALQPFGELQKIADVDAEAMREVAGLPEAEEALFQMALGNLDAAGQLRLLTRLRLAAALQMSSGGKDAAPQRLELSWELSQHLMRANLLGELTESQRRTLAAAIRDGAALSARRLEQAAPPHVRGLLLYFVASRAHRVAGQPGLAKPLLQSALQQAQQHEKLRAAILSELAALP